MTRVLRPVLGALLALAAAPLRDQVLAQCADYRTGLRWVGFADIVGSPDDMAVQGTLLHAAWGTGYSVFDISNPARPTLVGTIGTSGWSHGVSISGAHAYVAAGYGLHVIDVSDPGRPVLVTTAMTAGREVLDVEVAGSFAYVADAAYGLSVFDLGVPAAPRLIKTFGTPGYGLALGNATVYIAAGEAGLRVLGLQNPTTLRFAAGIDTPGEARQVAIAGSHAYVADGSGGLQIIDVADPAHPTWVAAVDAELLGTVWDVATAGTLAYVTCDVGVVVFDVSQPAEPRLVDQAFAPAECITVAGSHVYVAQGSALDVLEFSDPGSMDDVLGTATMPGGIADVVRAGAFAYVTEYSEYDDGSLIRAGGLRVLDVTDAAQPRPVGSLDVSTGLGAAAISGSHVLAASGIGLRIIDVSLPEAPRLVSLFGGSVGHVAVAGLLAFAAESDALHVLDVSSPESPVLLGTLDSFAWVKGLAVSGGNVYVLDAAMGVVVVDVSDPANPVASGSVSGPWAQGSRSLAVAGSHVYVSANTESWDRRRGDGFWVIDVANPGAPQVVAHIPCRSGDLAADGSYAYVGTAWGVVLVDISVPTAPEIAGGLGGCRPYRLTTDGAAVYIAAADRLQILPMPCVSTPVSVFDLGADARDGGVLLHWRTSGPGFTGFEVRRSQGTEDVSLGRAEEHGDHWEYWDGTVQPAETYSYCLVASKEDGATVLLGPVVVSTPSPAFALEAVWPSPARDSARITFSVPRAEMVSVEIYDARGRRVRRLLDDVLGPGRQVTSWDGRGDGGENVGSGLYFVRMSWASGARVRRIVFLR